MEVHDFVSHILEHSIEGQVVVLTQTQLKEGHILLIWLSLITKLVVQEAAEELSITLLGVDGEGLAVDSTFEIVVSDGLSVGLEHTEKDKEGANHHACAPLTSLAMHDDNRLLWQLLLFVLKVILVLMDLVRKFVVLFHSLQKERCIHAESEDFLQVGDVVVEERELADREALDRVLGVLVASFGAQVIDLDHVAVVFIEEFYNVCLLVSVEALEAFSWETAGDDTIRDIGQI